MVNLDDEKTTITTTTTVPLTLMYLNRRYVKAHCSVINGFLHDVNEGLRALAEFQDIFGNM